MWCAARPACAGASGWNLLPRPIRAISFLLRPTCRIRKSTPVLIKFWNVSWCAATAKLSQSISISSRWRSRRRSCGSTRFTAIQAKANRFRTESPTTRTFAAESAEMANPPVDFRLLAGAGVPARDFKAGDVIFRQGDLAQELFIIQSGEVEIRLGNRVLETLPAYSIFGEMALIDNAPRSATAVAASDAKLVPIGEKQFLFLISNTPHFALNVMRVMARRLRAANTAL